MVMPLHFTPGIAFDGRTIVVSVAALYFGPVAAALPVATAVTIRTAAGGAGMIMGILTTVSAALIGLLFRRGSSNSQPAGFRRLIVMGAVVHAVMLVLTITLPADAMREALPAIWAPVIMLFPLATVLIGKVLDDQIYTRRLQRELTSQKRELLHIIASLPGAIFKQAPTPDTPFEFVSRGIMDLTGYPPEHFESGAVCLESILQEREAARRSAGIRSALAEDSRKDHQTHFYVEYRLQSAAGRTVCIAEHGSITRDATGAPECIYGMLLDITDQKTAEQSVHRAYEEREALLHELFHRNNNTMQIIQSLLRMQINRADPCAVPYLRTATGRIQAMAIAQHKLYHADDLTNIDLLSLCTDLTSLVLSDLPDKTLRVDSFTGGEPVQTGLEVAVPLALVVYEALSNAVVHAFKERRCGRLETTVSRLSETGAEIRVRDNGKGLPAGFSLDHCAGFGLGAARDLIIRQLQGELSIQTVADDSGAVWTETIIRVGRLK